MSTSAKSHPAAPGKNIDPILKIAEAQKRADAAESSVHAAKVDFKQARKALKKAKKLFKETRRTLKSAKKALPQGDGASKKRGGQASKAVRKQPAAKKK